MPAGTTTTTPFSRRQIAILLGIPATIALAYYIYRRKSSSSFKSHQESIEGVVENNVASKPSEEDAEEKKKRLLKEALSFKEKGNESYRKGKYDEAIEFYDKAIEKCPTDKKIDLAIFYQNRAASYEMLHRWQQVKEDCTTALESNPKYPKAYARRSKANQQLGNLYECLDDLTATCILESFQNKKTVEDVETVLKSIAEKEAAEHMKNKLPELPSVHFIKTFLDAFTKDPIKSMDLTDEDNTKGFARAKLGLDAGNYEEIVPGCTEEINSTDPKYKHEALLLRGTIYTLMGLFQEAEDDFTVVIDKADADPKLRASALMRRATLNVQKEKKDLGFADYNEAEKLEPNNPDIFHNRAQIHVLLDQLDQALEDYDKVLKLSPDHAMAYIQKCYAEYRIALMAQDQGRLMSVMNDFKNALGKYPNCIECYSLMAQVLCELGQFDEADQYFEKAIKIDPLNATLHVHRGVMYMQWKGDINKAIDIISKSIEIDSKCEFAYEMLGTIAIQRAELQKAIDTFEKAVKYARNFTELTRLCALKCAAVAQLNVTKKLGIDVSAIVGLCK